MRREHVTSSAEAVYQKGASDPVLTAVKAQFARLGYAVGDVSDPAFDDTFEFAVRSFQQIRGLYADGRLGPQTFYQLELARHRLGDRVLRFDPVRPLMGDDVAQLQHRLAHLGIYTDRIDYVYAERTDAAVREVQADLGIEVDGIVGLRTLRGLDDVTRDGSHGNVFALKERARIKSVGSSLSGRTFIIDARPHVPIPEGPFVDEHRERALQYAHDIARRVEGRLAAVGASPIVLTRDSQTDDHTGEISAAALVTISHDFHQSPEANGTAAFYYGTVDGSFSPVGAHLAELIHREITTRTDFLDCDVHARTWSSLAKYPLPTVHIVAGYMTNPVDADRLHSATVRDTIAESIAVGIQRLYLPDTEDPETGSIDLTSLRRILNERLPR